MLKQLKKKIPKKFIVDVDLGENTLNKKSMRLRFININISWLLVKKKIVLIPLMSAPETKN